MKLEAGKYYKTRDGQKAFVGMEIPDPSRQCPFIGYLVGENCIRSWGRDGAYVHHGKPDPIDLVEEWVETPPVGSTKWAEAQPVGTRIRWHRWGDGDYVTRTADGWEKSDDAISTPSGSREEPSGWEVCSAPVKTIRPWTPAEVKLDAWYTHDYDQSRWFRLTAVCAEGVSMDGGRVSYGDLLKHYKWFTSQDRTLRKCRVEEVSR